MDRRPHIDVTLLKRSSPTEQLFLVNILSIREASINYIRAFKLQKISFVIINNITGY